MILAASLTVLLCASDAGTSSPLQPLLAELMKARLAASAEQRAQFVASVQAAREHASPDERVFLDRLTRLMDLEPDPKTTFTTLVQLTREALVLERGRFAEERALTATFLSFPLMAPGFQLDPAPLATEALTRARELVKRWPREASAHGVVASALQAQQAPDAEVLAALEKCASLDTARATDCRDRRARLVAERSRPRCAGTGLRAPLTFTGAQEAATNAPGMPLTVGGVNLTVEAQPFLDGAELASISVDDEGDLQLVATPKGTALLAEHTRRLAQTHAGFVVIRFGNEVLMAPRLMGTIEGGRVNVTRGGGRPPFTVDALCGVVERPHR